MESAIIKKRIIVTFQPDKEQQEIFAEILGPLAEIDCLAGRPAKQRARLLEAAEILVALSFSSREIAPGEIGFLQNVRFCQLIFAGADNVPFASLPAGLRVASNTGAFAEPIAEHVLALALALAKNLCPNYRKLRQGDFDQSGMNRALAGGTCAVIGFGGNGRAIGAIMGAVGMQVYGINRSGKTDAPIDFIGTGTDLQQVLQAADVVVVTTPLTRATRDLIGAEQLQWMKPDAVLINVGRGEVINQRALYEHLKANPDFRAGIDTWWSEPVSHGEFRVQYPFFELPNLIGSPHIADHVPGSMARATRRALENVKSCLLGKEVRGLANPGDYLE